MGWETGLTAERDSELQRRNMARGGRGWAHRILAASTPVVMAVYHRYAAFYTSKAAMFYL